MEITQASTERENRHMMGFLPNTLPNSICGLRRATWKKDKYRDKTHQIFVCLLFKSLITCLQAIDNLFWQPLQTHLSPSTWKWSWLGHHFMPCILHNISWAVLLDYSKLQRCSRASRSFINCSTEIPWLLTLLNDREHLDIDGALSSIGEASVLMVI